MKRVLTILFSVLFLAFTGCQKNNGMLSISLADGSLETAVPKFTYYPADTVKCNAVLFPDDVRSIVDNQEHTITVDENNVAHIGYSGTLKAGMTVAYPKTLFSSAKSGKVHVKFPEVQEYKVGDDGRQILDFPRYGVVKDDKTIALYSSCSVQKISIKNSQLVDISVDEVTFYLPADHDGCLWGEADIDATKYDAINPSNLTGGGKSIKMQPADFVIKPGETRELYVCVPDPKVGLYFSVTFTELDLEECTLIYNAPGADFGSNYLVLETIEMDTHNNDILRIRPSDLGKLSGDGTETNPFLVYTADDLYKISSNLSDRVSFLNIVQMNDIDFSSKSVSGNSVLGDVTTLYYNGHGHVLSGTKQPLVSYAGDGSVITDLCFKTDARPLARRLKGTRLYNIRVVGERKNIDGESVIGGIVDTMSYSKMVNCQSSADIKLLEGDRRDIVIGGLAGWAYGVYTGDTRCYFDVCSFDGDIDATAANTIANCKVGGIVGSYDNGVLYLLATVNSDIQVSGALHSGYTLNVGGLVGYVDCDGLTIDVCSTYGSVDAGSCSIINLGGMVGYFRAGTADVWASHAYNTVNSSDSSDQTNIGGFMGFACGAKDILKFASCSSEMDKVRGRGVQEVYAGGYIGTLIDNPDYIVVQMCNCKNLAEVVASCEVDDDYWRVAGGFIGYCQFSNDTYKDAPSMIVNSENRGVISCDGPNNNRYKGGFIGWVYKEATYVINCFSWPRIKDDNFGYYGLIGSMIGSGGHLMYGAGNHLGRNGSTHPAIGYGGITDGTYNKDYTATTDDAPIPQEIVNSLNDWVYNIHCVDLGWYTYDYKDGGTWSTDGLH